MNRRVHARAVPAVLIAVLALVAAGLMSPATAATSTAKLKGVVTLSGKPITFAKVQLFRAPQDEDGDDDAVPQRVKTDNTDSAGRYSFSGLKAKGYNYTILVTDRTGRTVKTSRSVYLRAGRTATKNVHMAIGATLRGKVTTVDGRSPAGLTFGVYDASSEERGGDYAFLYPAKTTTIAADGTFELANLPVNPDYNEAFVADGPRVKQCYDFVAGTLVDCRQRNADDVQRQRVSLVAGEVRTLPTVTVTKLAPPVTTVKGKVTDTSGKALKGIAVRIFADDPDAQVDQTVTTRSSGRFTLTDELPAGTYKVRFDDPNNMWASQYLGGGPDKSVRQAITVTPGQPIAGLDTRLKSLSTAKIASKGGDGTAKVAFQVKRKVSGSAPSGTVKLSFGGVSKSVAVVKGRATVTLSGIPAGTRSLVADYSGTASTAGFSKVVKVAVK